MSTPEALSNYFPILIVFLIAAGFAGVSLVLTHRLGPRIKTRVKLSPYESGVDPLTDIHTHISVRFFIVALTFLIFDIEVVFLYPWAVVYRKYLSSGTFIFFEMLVFLAILLIGYVYVWRKGVFEWE